MVLILPQSLVGPDEVGEFEYIVKIEKLSEPYDEVYSNEFAFRADSDAAAIYRCNTNQIVDDLELQANLPLEDISEKEAMRKRPIYMRYLYRRERFGELIKVEVSSHGIE